MNRTSFRKLLAPSVAVLALSISLTACGASNEAGAESGGDTSEAGGLSGDLNGAGASSQEKAQGAWSTGFQGMNDGNVTVNYDPVGSGDGRTNFIEGGVSFAGSDSYLNDDEGELSAAKERCGGEDPIEVPAYVSPIAVAFNLDGVDALNLDADTIAMIFDNKITNWNDKAIADQNPDATLPDLAITPVHRSDDSGTTKNFTDYLGKASGSWSYEAEDAFPVKGGEAAEGTSGVISAVSGGKGTIGYADESQVGDLSVVSVKVGEEYVAPSAEGAAKVVETSPAAEGRADVDMAVDIDRTTTESGAYPVVLLSYLIACQTYEDQAEADLVSGYLSYIVSDEGQAAASQEAGSAPLSASVAEQAQSIVDAISAG
ncbi:phosphate ABC transporter substrate-binding protein PstS [Nocardioides cavernae]|uniref:Phosphate-binding protein n=1 Tax=Nocardioides cavernae TaxID=1921566 RepID=A0ABR8N5Q4_9ACTN|nr:phosphate ABC transporter substrate-binding protein PstS [Nocardioides cavernae]MBD3923483.1 phosphate ABC transporter substrate-binding protein PstS [Nocardioides cavernae]MBM7511591.1 phosphate transport system substrate-binding protein [Nocardioides cavernae]